MQAAFVVETVIWGVPSAWASFLGPLFSPSGCSLHLHRYGVFLNYYQQRSMDPISSFSRGASLLPLVGTFSSGLMYLLGTPIALILNPRPRWRTSAIRLGAAVTVIALLASSFATTVSAEARGGSQRRVLTIRSADLATPTHPGSLVLERRLTHLQVD